MVFQLYISTHVPTSNHNDFLMTLHGNIHYFLTSTHFQIDQFSSIKMQADAIWLPPPFGHSQCDSTEINSNKNYVQPHSKVVYCASIAIHDASPN